MEIMRSNYSTGADPMSGGKRRFWIAVAERAVADDVAAERRMQQRQRPVRNLDAFARIQCGVAIAVAPKPLRPARRHSARDRPRGNNARRFDCGRERVRPALASSMTTAVTLGEPMPLRCRWKATWQADATSAGSPWKVPALSGKSSPKRPQPHRSPDPRCASGRPR